jgi:hypothetical protein
MLRRVSPTRQVLWPLAPGRGRFVRVGVSLVLRSVPDPAAALAELHHAIRPGGELRF